MHLPLFIHMVVFVGLIFLLAQTRKTDWSLSKKVLADLILGVVFGLGLHLIYGGGHPILAEYI
ncbi:L-cystine transporter, partial [Acinetobacter baumannii]